MSDLFKKLNNDTIAGIIFVAKLGVVFLVKKWVETFSETVFAALNWTLDKFIKIIKNCLT
ncbi:hypothetical protein [Candidiatus Paracoxiella cheracis]|uniref:hypothetical protein n=1 Tax=Candidiatus Paracoxiella cheracis TaxID=3405120 RepID=UPI003BF47EC5